MGSNLGKAACYSDCRLSVPPGKSYVGYMFYLTREHTVYFQFSTTSRNDHDTQRHINCTVETGLINKQRSSQSLTQTSLASKFTSCSQSIIYRYIARHEY
jgi:hypothetical protein